jgi:hypothetical protein
VPAWFGIAKNNRFDAGAGVAEAFEPGTGPPVLPPAQPATIAAPRINAERA